MYEEDIVCKIFVRPIKNKLWSYRVLGQNKIGSMTLKYFIMSLSMSDGKTLN